jgi:ubiquinone/menaquinone biosynthesis C-methylase UbiE
MENPRKILGSFVRPGMTVLEPGSAMGYFTLPLAKMVGPQGKVVAIDIQPKMLAGLERRARRAGLADRLDLRLAQNGSMGLDDLPGKVDFAAALHLVHEVPDQKVFFKEMHKALRPGAKLLVIEPKGHVSKEAFAKMDSMAQSAGLRRDEWFEPKSGHKALYTKAAA